LERKKNWIEKKNWKEKKNCKEKKNGKKKKIWRGGGIVRKRQRRSEKEGDLKKKKYDKGEE
jgi:hypothetical protein